LEITTQKSGKQSGNCTKLNVDGLCYNNENVIKGFHKHFSSVFSPEHKHNTDITEELNDYCKYDENGNRVNDILTKSFTEEEIGNIITSLSKRKSPGNDGVLNEHLLYMYAGDAMYKGLTHLFNAILHFERIPSAWKTSILIPIYKGKGKCKSDPNNYRPISLPCFCKIFEKAILNRINNYKPEVISNFPSPQQHGFQKHFSCVTAAFALQETIYYNIERQCNVYVAFLDQKAAFDCINHERLFG